MLVCLQIVIDYSQWGGVNGSFMLINSLKELPKENWLLFMATLINRIGSMAFIFLILYLQKHLNFSVQIGGFVLALYGVGAVISGLLGGRLTDLYSPFRIMSLSLLISSIIMLLYPLIHNLYLLCIVTFLWGLIRESYQPAIQVAIQKFSSSSQRKLAFSLQRLAFNVGIVVAPLLGGLLISYNYNAIFIVDGITTLAAWLFIHYKFKIYMQDFQVNTPEQPLLQDFKAAYHDKKMLYPMLGLFLILIVFFQFGSTLPVFMVNNLHLSTTAFGLICAINGGMVILLQLHTSSYTTHWQYNRALSLGVLLIAFAFGSYTFAASIWMIIFGVILLTIGEMIFFPSLAAYVSEIAPPKQDGFYMGIYSTTLNAAMVMAPIIGTQLLHRYGASSLWEVCFVIGIVAAFVFAFGVVLTVKTNELNG